MNRHFCAVCSGPLARHMVDGRERDVCQRCGQIFYENPLPVAASVVLNDRREVLLVKRKHEPAKGLWCLPTGFAESGESIEDAALRELKEEAGLTGRILQLLDVDSLPSDFYGDLLIVTFEVATGSGRPIAGDDAEEVGFFLLNAPPPLAFSSNAKALRACLEAHRDEWAIGDSYQKLKAQGEQELLSDTLLWLLSESASAVAQAWLVDVQTNASTPSYHRFDPTILKARAETALSHLEAWLRHGESDPEVQEFYTWLGRDRKKGGVALSEVMSSLMLLRKNIWLFARDAVQWNRPIDAYRALELSGRIVAFFDRVMYITSMGYAEGGESETQPPKQPL